jgi:hypothetical protein
MLILEQMVHLWAGWPRCAYSKRVSGYGRQCGIARDENFEQTGIDAVKGPNGGIVKDCPLTAPKM